MFSRTHNERATPSKRSSQCNLHSTREGIDSLLVVGGNSLILRRTSDPEFGRQRHDECGDKGVDGGLAMRKVKEETWKAEVNRN